MTIAFGDAGSIPNDLFSLIACRLDGRDLHNMSCVCKRWREHLLSDSFHNLYLSYNPHKYSYLKPMEHSELVRDRSELNFTVIEEKNGSDFENFSESGMNHTSEEKFPIDESIFPSRTVIVNSVRSLRKQRESFYYWVSEAPFKPGAIIDERFDINAQFESSGITPLLMWISRNGSRMREFIRNRVALLLRWGADVNVAYDNGDSALMEAVNLHDLELVKLLLDAGADIHHRNLMGATALTYALSSHNISLASYIFNRGGRGPVDLDDLSVVIQEGDDLLAEYCVRNSQKIEETHIEETLFQLSLRLGKLRTAQALMECGSDCDISIDDGVHLFKCAIKSGSVEFVDFTLRQGSLLMRVQYK